MTQEFKNIIGEVKNGEVATIRFFGKINEERANQFCAEFDYLENYVRPKLIRVLINSEGGSVLYGMSIYSTIQNSTVDTECIVEGMAASMGSVIWAAGKRSLMWDYSILNIHNPFLPGVEDSKEFELVKAFINQIKTIYRKRFGLKKEEVERIMDGEAGNDGTFFDAKSAVKAGIIPAENILHTNKQLCEKVKNELLNLTEASDIQSMMTRICAQADMLELKNKHFSQFTPSLNQSLKTNKNMTEVTNNHEYSAVAASLGFKDNFEVKDVMSRISELLSVEAKLTEANTKLTDAQTVIAGKDATIQNLQKDNGDLTVVVNAYKAKETQEKKARIETLVDGAITEGKIDQASKEQWVAMAEANYELAEKTLSSIPAPEKITQQIATDPENVKAAAEAAKTAEQLMADKVSTVVGEKFEFKKLK
ncbi:ATP-dependent Clp protease proteolytic subunit [Bacteroides sp. 51]|uniref:Clp protease ClpP n=1 Tax=Bacteroides sp. 51 TaxID=2302938 RepID=UPI0013D3D78A|nr:Clp protease ClpP [Bacteroides sp. 51]NDV80818.1 Clp protease ClpP [Bacteroides sp. 51]